MSKASPKMLRCLRFNSDGRPCKHEWNPRRFKRLADGTLVPDAKKCPKCQSPRYDEPGPAKKRTAT